MNIIFRRDYSFRQLIVRFLLFKPLQQFFLLSIILLTGGCIKQFTPEISENQNILVVEGLITDQPGQNIIKVSESMPLGIRYSPNPLSGCVVTISDDLGDFYTLAEQPGGIYITNPPFQGVIGRVYTLHIKTNGAHQNLSYQSNPMLMKPVPPIDSIYYTRKVFSQFSPTWPTGEGCEIFLSTHDPDNNCRFYRWEFVETWEMRLPYATTNNHCWITAHSDKINIKTTTALTEDKIEKMPINIVSNATDRLQVRYSILINQYSLNEDEYVYWDKLQNIGEQVGTLYDIIPASTVSNMWCIEKPADNVLGYFSVSAVKSKRLFIKDTFRGLPQLYDNCENSSVSYNDSIPGLNYDRWVIIAVPTPPPGYKILTFLKGCADCTVRGTTTMPDYWNDTSK
jgi:hypothetical protein